MPTVKKTVTKKAGGAKKARVKKAPTAKKSVAKHAPKVRSFRISPNNAEFKSFKITRQTIYWLILGVYIIVMQLWILSLQIQTSNYIQEELNTVNSVQ